MIEEVEITDTTETKNVFSLNLIAYLQMLDVSYELCNENNLFYAIVADDDELNQAIDKYKSDEKLQSFLHSFRQVRDEINSIRCKS